MTDDNMLSRERSDAELEAAKPINLSEALGDAAHKQKRNLVSWAAVAILVRYYHIDLTKIPWIDADIPTDASKAAIVVVAAPLLYSLIGFLIYAIGDIKKWRFDDDWKYLEPTWQIFYRLEHSIAAIKSQLHPIYRQAKLSPEQRNAVIEDALAKVTEGKQSLTVLQHNGQRLTWWKRITVYGWELAVPLFLGVVALFLALPALVSELWRILGK